MWERVQDRVAYAVLLATCVAGIIHTSWWAAVAGACLLAILSLVQRQYVGHRYETLHRAVPDTVHVMSSTANAAIFSTAAFSFGHLTRILWGL